MAVRPGTQPARRGPREERHEKEASHHLAARLLAAVALPCVVLAAVAAATGWLYLLRSGGLLGLGPRISGSLELERLADADAQPLLRVAVAFIPAGIAAGMVLASVSAARRSALATLIGSCGLLFLLALGAVSDAIENSETLRGHLSAQPGRAGPWVAAVFLFIGAYLGTRDRAARPGRAARASSAG